MTTVDVLGSVLLTLVLTRLVMMLEVVVVAASVDDSVVVTIVAVFTRLLNGEGKCGPKGRRHLTITVHKFCDWLLQQLLHGYSCYIYFISFQTWFHVKIKKTKII